MTGTDIDTDNNLVEDIQLMTIFLDGMAAQYYRGIGKDVQYIGPFSNINLFIGSNNSGKSIVLSLLSDRIGRMGANSNWRDLSGSEVYMGRNTGRFMLAKGIRADKVVELTNSYLERLPYRSDLELKEVQVGFNEVVNRISFNGIVWVSYLNNRLELYPKVDFQEAKDWPVNWRLVWTRLTNRSGGSLSHWIPDVLSHISGLATEELPRVHLIPAKRTVGRKGEAFDDLSGKGLIDHLAGLQNPNFDRQLDREKFRKINLFLQDVTGKSDAKLEVPSDREHLLVHMDNKVLPLASLGTGIHEVILIAAFCTIHDESIMCIEEPEIHLHPLLQKKLINYLIKKTNSQYFIATHSSSFIDTEGANIFGVKNDGEKTTIRTLLDKNAQREIIDDLGYQASDILQSNYVIWVEGPSDRIYINHWINSFAPELVESIHYTIMFYGGALIRHLSASDEAVSDFIRLKDLNRNMAIVIDSDRSSESSALKPHAQRLYDEIGKDGGFVWITDGREMENYIDGSLLQSALKAIHPKIYSSPSPTGKFDHAFYFMRESSDQGGKRTTFKDADKVGVAALVCEQEADLEILDLRVRVQQLSALIRAANGLE